VLVFAGKRWTRKQEGESDRITVAEDEFEQTVRRVRESFPWASKALGFLSAAEIRAVHNLARLEAELDRAATAPESWNELTPGARLALEDLVQLAVVTMTVLPLPAIATPIDGESDNTVENVESVSRYWNAAVLDEALAWFALG
jgi:hypothetical protein